MDDYRIERVIVLDDGSDGFFWRNGEHWLRERGEEFRLLDLAPNLERQWLLANNIKGDGPARH